jgi:cytochrome c553
MKSLLLIPVIATMLVGGVYLMADDDHYEKGNIKQRAAQLPVSPQQQSYIKECSSCHMAYQAEFLPKRTWAKMIAADSKRVGKHLAKMAASAGDTSLRISDTRYFKKEHRKIPQKYIDQKEVKSIANCNACHQKAESGDYRERGISIPNYGRWDD